ncbi:transporter, divalent anion:Na+ symporter family protein [Yersinia rochesterensis]|uniref:DASS family sodium-coupled anion symporter n=1 Tax=Yersinia rochesterensis TaxID=1604335 RepID=A0A386HIX0_9GAMM|nr:MULTISPECIES: DASS family sodium-coupled anion symporter [Yersinia]AJI87508.1 transporter, divalent anion:Na+ symporter family protein [Yersinia frederiksenii Y225]CNH91058.1 putative membrane transport protein [Yersinia kristensenii]AJJ34056.1 transporter, divalent anion:Na+ symporter family protein [Yersinia rochesterensis]AYD45481.1 DASS family sodium-coupled anion symporter [Yersinia rochesterensis]CRY66503.1 putative membrane transport protein [Yersinia kristensenii]
MLILKTRIGKMLLILLIGISIWFSPVPESVDPRAWHLMAVFAATVIGVILSPYPLGAMAVFGLTAATATGLLSIKEVLAGFSDPIIWMIACAFFISRSFIKTGFGRRVGYLFISKLGHSSLGLAYGLVLTDLLFAPAMPSTAARCGGIITPLFRSISDVYESNPEQSTERKIGAFLVQCIVQCNAIICAMFLTSMAGNPMIGKLAGEMGITITWASWALAAIVPGLISLTVIPLLLYRFYPPELKKTPEMRAQAIVKLKEMGRMSRNEWIVLSVFIGLVTLWVCGTMLNIDATITAFIGLAILLLSGVLTWDDVIAEKEAWHTMIWFAVLLTLASQLNKLGFIRWFGASMAGSVQGMNWVPMMGILLLAYYYSHYMMASAIAHISAMYTIFVSITISAGAPPMLTGLVFGMFSNLYMATTHYSGGPAAILFGCNFIPLTTWWKIGFLISLVVIPIWLIIGSVWWKVLGFW